MKLFPTLGALLRVVVLVFGLAIGACSSDGNDGGAGGSGGGAGSSGTGGGAGAGGDAGAGGAAGSGGSGGGAGVGGGGAAGSGGVGASGGAGGVGGDGGGDGFSDPSALDAIDAALEAGEISEIDALRFKVFAVFGDERLPEAYRASGIFEGTEVVEALGERWSSLPANVQTELEPFILPPVAEGSWFDLQEQQATQQAQKSGSVAPKAPAFSSVSAVLNRVRIRYPAGFTELATQAGWVKEALENDGVWDGLIDLMGGREPVSDDGIDERYNGGDDRFDIYIVRAPNITNPRRRESCFGWASPYSPGFFARNTGDNRRAMYLVINADVAVSEIEVKSTVAHEFFHAVQRAFDTPYTEDRSWLAEATATWAEDKIYPDANTEHLYAGWIHTRPDLTLTSRAGNHEYAAWMYWYFLTKRFDDESIIPRAWELSEEMPVIDAVDEVTPGGFINTFQEFAATLWNRAGFHDDPPYDIYKNDGLRNFVGAPYAKPTPNPEDDREVSFADIGIARLSSQYFEYDLNDVGTQSVLFANGYSFELAEGVPNALQSSGTHTLYAKRMDPADRLGRKVLAIVEKDGTWQDTVYDLTDVAFAPFCREVGSERIDRLAVVFVNAEHRETEPFFASPRGLPPRLLASNMGCGKWSGTGTAQQVILDGNDTMFANVEITNIEFSRDTLTLEEIADGAGQFAIGDERLPPGELVALNSFPGDAYELTKLEANWQYDEDTEFGGIACSASGSGTFDVDDTLMSDFRVSSYLRTVSGAPSIDPLYRSFLTQLTLYTGESAIPGTCVSNGETSPYETSLIVGIQGGYRDGQFGMLSVDPSGERINVSWSFNDLDATLDLTSGPIP